LHLSKLKKDAVGRNTGGIRIFVVDALEYTIYRGCSMSYELELEIATNIQFKNFSHDREGLTAALNIIEQNKSIIVAATIISSRDGVVYTF
jgi:hypothetical protein